MLTTTKTETSPAVQDRSALYDCTKYDVTKETENTWRVTHRSEMVAFRCWKGRDPGTLVVDGSENGGGQYVVTLGATAAEHRCGCPHGTHRPGAPDKHIACAVALAAFCAARRVLARMA